MKLRFEEKSDISTKDPCVVIQAEQLSSTRGNGLPRTIFSCKSSGDSY